MLDRKAWSVESIEGEVPKSSNKREKENLGVNRLEAKNLL